MKKEKKSRLWKGRKVKVFDVSQEYIGIGKYIDSQILECGRLGKCWIPRFRINGKIYYGYDCWWIPLSDTRKLESGMTPNNPCIAKGERR